MTWVALAAPACTLLGAIFGGLISLRINASNVQHGIADEFSKLSSAQAVQIDTLHTELGRLRERISKLEADKNEWEKLSSLRETRYKLARVYISQVVEWDAAGRPTELPTVPEFD